MRNDKLRKNQLTTYAYGSFLVSAAVLTVFVILQAMFGLLVHLNYFSPDDGNSFGTIMGMFILLPVLIIHITAMLIGIALSLILHRRLLTLISSIGIVILVSMYSITQSTSSDLVFKIGSFVRNIDILQLTLGFETVYVVLIGIFGGKWYWKDRYKD